MNITHYRYRPNNGHNHNIFSKILQDQNRRFRRFFIFLKKRQNSLKHKDLQIISNAFFSVRGEEILFFSQIAIFIPADFWQPHHLVNFRNTSALSRLKIGIAKSARYNYYKTNS
jgi:hypothetical protein